MSLFSAQIFELLEKSPVRVGRKILLFVFFTFLQSACVASQSFPGTSVRPIETYANTGNCAKINCEVNYAQYLAVEYSVSLYQTEFPSIKVFSLEVGVNSNGFIVVTIFPYNDVFSLSMRSYSGAKQTITYVVNSAGTKLIKKIYNR